MHFVKVIALRYLSYLAFAILSAFHLNHDRASAQSESAACNGTFLTVELAFSDPSYRHFLGDLKPRLYVEREDESAHEVEPSSIQIGQNSGNSALEFCLAAPISDAALLVGTDRLRLNVDLDQVPEISSLRDYQLVSDFDFAIATDFSVTETDIGQLVMSFSILNPSAAKYGINVDAAVGWFEPSSCFAPSPFIHHYYLDLSVGKEARLFREIDDLKLRRPAEFERYKVNEVPATLQGDFCSGIGADLRASLGRLHVDPEEEASTFYIVISSDTFVPLHVLDPSIFFSGASLTFSGANVFPTQLNVSNLPWPFRPSD